MRKLTKAEQKVESGYFTACPRCGQVGNGFTYSTLAYINYTGFWGEANSQENSDYTVIKVPKTVVCADCGYRVPMDKALPESP